MDDPKLQSTAIVLIRRYDVKSSCKISGVKHVVSKGSVSRVSVTKKYTSKESTEGAQGSQLKQGVKEIFACGKCGKRFPYRYRLILHQKRMSRCDQPRTQSSTSHTCPTCKKVFHKKARLARHQLSHEGNRSHQCDVCGCSFFRLDQLKVHARTHADHRQFQCTLCDKQFKRSDHLSSHMRTHTGEKPYKCSLCGASFAQSTKLSRHLAVHQEDLKEFHCTVCNMAFAAKENLNRHLKTHTGPDHQCDVCGKFLSRLDKLIEHAKSHSSVKPFKCKYCEKTFVDHSRMKQHQDRTHIAKMTRNECTDNEDRISSTKLHMEDRVAKEEKDDEDNLSRGDGRNNIFQKGIDNDGENTEVEGKLDLEGGDVHNVQPEASDRNIVNAEGGDENNLDSDSDDTLCDDENDLDAEG